MTKLFSVEIPIWATAYIKADTPERALEIAQGLDMQFLHVSGSFDSGQIDNSAFDQLQGDVSIAPNMTIHRIEDDDITRVEEVHDYGP